MTDQTVAPPRGWYTTQEARQRLHVSKSQLLAYIEEGALFAEQDRFGCWQICTRCVAALGAVLNKRRELARAMHAAQHDAHKLIPRVFRPPKPRAQHPWREHENPAHPRDRA